MGRVERTYDREAFISEYATSHAWEDWAETFAHFLHIVARSIPLPRSRSISASDSRQTLEDPYLEEDFEALLASWNPVAYSMKRTQPLDGAERCLPVPTDQSRQRQAALCAYGDPEIRSQL